MQLTREDWIGAGLHTLAASGIEGVKVEALAKALHISKGSFYHYWSDRAEFLEALLVDWEEHGTRRVIDDLEKIASPHERFQRLFEFSFSSNKRLEAAIHHWANVDTAVAQRVARAEDVRKAYITKLLCDMGKPFIQAREAARIYYLVYLGWIDWSERNEVPAGELADIYRTLMAW
ncbi:MAG TPA: TetR/AcrR family transcriptional regulator [Ktedonosporobacter sp.]|nr:TetR/AcrR family transcriptional regulator [Ktedonosporobacter sp.]